MMSQSQIRKKRYTSPKINKLTTEQANLILIGHAGCGDQGARDLLNVLYPLKQADGNQEVYSEEDEPRPTISGPSRLIRRVLAAFQYTRENFGRFVRG